MRTFLSLNTTRTFLVLAMLTVLLVIGHPAKADQPYGGCDEAWQAPRSTGADHCRSHGWTVRPRFVLTPDRHVAYNRLPACEYEDSNGCYWNARTSGNGQGHSFIAGPRGRVFYVTF